MGATGGGSATNAGIDFQQRVAAWLFVCMLLDNGDEWGMEAAHGRHMRSVAFETGQPIDDIRVGYDDAVFVYVQAKRTISLSSVASSEFVKVIEQFVAQFRGSISVQDCYVLATSSEASNKIIRELRKLLSSVRLDKEGYIQNPLSRSEADTLRIFREVVHSAFRSKADRDMSESEFAEFAARTHVEVFDVESGMPQERAAIALLGSVYTNKVQPGLLWSQLITNALIFATNRQSLSQASLRELVGRLAASKADDAERTDRETSPSFVFQGDLASGRECLVVKAPIEGHDYLVVELFRFNDDCTKRLRFVAPDKCMFQDDSEFAVVYRSATWAGIERYFEDNRDAYKDREVAILPAKDINGVDRTPCASHYSALSRQRFPADDAFSACLHCGKPVFEPFCVLAEVDDEGRVPVLGVVHKRCLRPIDRVLGRVTSDAFQNFPFLRNFDLYQWARLIRRGQGFFNSVRSGNLENGKVVQMGWRPQGVVENGLSHCVGIRLNDGSIEYGTQRGKVERLSIEEAIRDAKFMNKSLVDARQHGDPYCVTSVRRVFGQRSTLMQIKGLEETCIEVNLAEIERYHSSIGDIYNKCENYLAPLVLLRHLITEQPITLNHHLVLLTDPFSLHHYLRNWADAGVSIDDYELVVVTTDHDFDEYVRRFLAAGLGVVINPVMSTGMQLISGFVLRDITELVEQRRNSDDV